MTRLFTSTPLRLALAVAGIYVIIGLVSFLVAFKVVEDNTSSTLRQTLEQEMAGLRAVPTQRALISLVQSQSEIADPDERILSYVLPGGALFGNAALFARGEGYRAVSFEPEANISGPYFALGEVMHGGVMTVAISARPLETLEDVFFLIFLYSFAPTTILVLLGSLLIARRMGRRLKTIDEMLGQLTTGNYAARLPNEDIRRDDIGQIASGINTMASAQERQMIALQQVSSDIAHDLKTPIQRLAFIVEDIAEARDVSEPVQKLSNEALSEARNIDQIFRALLQIAQVEGGALRARFEPVNLVEVIGTVCDLYRPMAEEEGRAFELSLPDTPIYIDGEKVLIGQMVSNLIENALRHTETGVGIALKLELLNARQARFSIADRGKGIAEDQRDFVLRRLARLDESRTTVGHGLGLSLVAATVEAHDGLLKLADADPGLLVTVTLPVSN